MRTLLPVMLSFLTGLSTATGAETVERFGLFEAAFTVRDEGAHPYVDVSAEAALVAPDGQRTVATPLFWDGGATWKLRVSPDQAGDWKYSIRSSHSELQGKSGGFQVIESKRQGSIRPMNAYPHHFERQDGSPFWFMGDTAWALFTDNEKEKFDRAAASSYLAARAAQGFNVVHSMLQSEAGWGNTGGPPWHDIAAERINPAYWQEVDKRLAYANSRGLVVGLALAWGQKGRQEPYAWNRFPDLEARKRYARYIAARYSAFDVYFIVSGEWHGEVRNRQASEDEVRRDFFAIGDALHTADPHKRMVAIHPMNSNGSVSEFNKAGWMSFGDYQQNYHDLHARLLHSRRMQKPVVNSEYGYFLRDQSGDGIPDKDNSTSLESMRHATWDLVMAGGYVVTGFGTTYFGGNRDPGPFDLEAAKNRPWEQQMGAMKQFFTAVPWWKLAPHDELISCATPRGKDTEQLGRAAPPETTYWCLSEPERQYVVYGRGLSAPLILALDSHPPLEARQFNPRTGEWSDLPSVPGVDSVKFHPPDTQDWIALFTAAK